MPDVYLFCSWTNAVMVAPTPTLDPKLFTLNLRSVEESHCSSSNPLRFSAPFVLGTSLKWNRLARTRTHCTWTVLCISKKHDRVGWSCPMCNRIQFSHRWKFDSKDPYNRRIHRGLSEIPLYNHSQPHRPDTWSLWWISSVRYRSQPWTPVKDESCWMSETRISDSGFSNRIWTWRFDTHEVRLSVRAVLAQVSWTDVAVVDPVRTYISLSVTAE